MVGMRLVGPLLVAAAAVGTLFAANFFIKKAGGETGPEEPLPPIEENTPSIPAGSLGSVTNVIEDAQKFASDFFIFDTRFSNLSDREQTFDAIMQIKQPNGQVATIKSTKITVEARSSRRVRFSSGNLFEFAVVRGIWNAEFFAWVSLELPIPLSQPVNTDFVVDVL